MDVLNPYRAGTGMSEGERVSTGPVDFVGVLSARQLFDAIYRVPDLLGGRYR